MARQLLKDHTSTNWDNNADQGVLASCLDINGGEMMRGSGREQKERSRIDSFALIIASAGVVV